MIAIVYPQFFQVGGIARYLDSFLSNLPERCGDIFLITSGSEQRVIDDPRIKVMAIPVPGGRFGLLIWALKVRRRLREMHRSGVVDCVNLHVPPLIPGLFIFGDFPVVLTAHSTYRGMSRQLKGRSGENGPAEALSVWVKMRMEKFLLSRAHSVITLTEQGRSELRTYGRTEDVVVLPNGVDVGQFGSARAAEKDIDVIFSGRIEQLKGSRAMVEVCRRLVARDGSIQIAIVGYGEDEAYVRSELGALKSNIFITGKVPFHEMASYYARSRVYVSTSYYEGLPGTCLEAMATGLPVAAWDLPFYRGLVANGEAGLLASANDHESLVGNVARLLNDRELSRALGQHGRAVVRSSYDWKTLAGQLLGVFEQATGQQRLARSAT